MKNFYTLLFTLLITCLGFGQVTAPGDIAFTAFNADGDDDFAIVALVDISANTEIYFTDNEPASATTLTTGEGNILWDTGGSVISAGTIVVFTDTDSSGNASFGASVGTLTYQSGSLNLSGGGDALYAFIGTSSTAPTAWIAGIQNEAGNQGAGFGTTGLTVGTTFINFFTSGSPDGGFFSGDRDTESTFADYLALLGDNTNWTRETSNGENILPISTTPFTLASGCTAPTTQASAYNTTSIGTTSATLNWTAGDGDEVLVVVKEGSAVDTDPTDGTSYTGNTVFSSGTEIGTGNFVVQSGSATSSVSITGLNPATTYHVAVYEYNTTGTCYELTELSGDFTTDCSIPTDTTALTATASNTTVDLSWVNGSCFDDILVVAKASSAVSVVPTGDGTAYTANTIFGSGTDLGTNEFAVFQGSGTSVTVTGLTNGTTYHFTVFARKTTSWSTGVSSSATPADIPSSGDIVISEIMYNSSGTDDEWVEIYNASGADITLDSDWRLNYGSSTFDFSGTFITNGSYLTIALGSNGDGTFNNDNPFTPDVSVIATPAATTNDSNNLVNSTATIAVIFEPAGANVIIDTVTYDDGSPWPTNPDGDGPSLELIDVSSDNSLAASWVASDIDGGTPGSAHPRTFTFTGTWSPSDPDGVATASDIIVIASGNATITTATACDTATISPGASLTVNTGITLTVTNGLTLESSSTSYSSLILDGTIAGIVNYERHVNGNSGLGDIDAIGNNDLISAPLTGQAFGAFAGANSNLLANPGDANEKAFAPFDKTTGDYENYFITTNEFTTLDAGVGYRAATNDTSTLTFTGTVNTGDITYNIVNSGPMQADWNLVGNPYPSYMLVQAFLQHEVDTGIENVDLFQPDTAAIYGYDGDVAGFAGYTIYNLANTTPTTVIAPGQGFLISANPSTSPVDLITNYDVEFTPTMRSTGTDDDFIVGRGNNALINLKLQLNSLTNGFTTDFYFNENAGLGLDPGYDAAIFGSAPTFALYSHLVEDNMGTAFAIQTLGIEDLMNTSIALGVNANLGEQLVFTISESTLSSTVEVYLDDTLSNTSTLLNTSDYIITPSTTLNGTGRFYLRFMDSSLSAPDKDLDSLNIYSDQSNKTIVIAGQLVENTNVKLYDIQGRIVSSNLIQNTNRQQVIDVSSLNTGIYVIELINGTQNKTQKVIIR